MSERVEMGLFPLSLVLLPGEVIPLHIFEERYKMLFADLAADAEFAVLHVEEAGLHEFGAAARVVEVTENLAGGRLNLLVRGERRLRLLELKAPEDLEADYMRGLVEFIDDTPSDASADLVGSVLEAFGKLRGLLGAEEPPAPERDVPLSYRIGATIEFGASFKQQLLETLSEQERLAALLSVMQALVPRVEARAKLQEAIRGNGKGA